MCMKKIERLKVKCKVCRTYFELDPSTAKKIALKHGGFIPCEHCGSHATQWDTKQLF